MKHLDPNLMSLEPRHICFCRGSRGAFFEVLRCFILESPELPFLGGPSRPDMVPIWSASVTTSEAFNAIRARQPESPQALNPETLSPKKP